MSIIGTYNGSTVELLAEGNPVWLVVRDHETSALRIRARLEPGEGPTVDGNAVVWGQFRIVTDLSPEDLQRQLDELMSGDGTTAAPVAYRPASRPPDPRINGPQPWAQAPHAAIAPSRDGDLTVPVLLTSLLAITVWAWAAISTYVQKSRMEDLIAEAGRMSEFNSDWDISAIQIQQLSGEVTTHAVVAVVIALALTMPLIITHIVKSSMKK